MQNLITENLFKKVLVIRQPFFSTTNFSKIKRRKCLLQDEKKYEIFVFIKSSSLRKTPAHSLRIKCSSKVRCSIDPIVVLKCANFCFDRKCNLMMHLLRTATHLLRQKINEILHLIRSYITERVLKQLEYKI